MDFLAMVAISLLVGGILNAGLWGGHRAGQLLAERLVGR